MSRDDNKNRNDPSSIQGDSPWVLASLGNNRTYDHLQFKIMNLDMHKGFKRYSFTRKHFFGFENYCYIQVPEQFKCFTLINCGNKSKSFCLL